MLVHLPRSRTTFWCSFPFDRSDQRPIQGGVPFLTFFTKSWGGPLNTPMALIFVDERSTWGGPVLLPHRRHCALMKRVDKGKGRHKFFLLLSGRTNTVRSRTPPPKPLLSLCFCLVVQGVYSPPLLLLVRPLRKNIIFLCLFPIGRCLY